MLFCLTIPSKVIPASVLAVGERSRKLRNSIPGLGQRVVSVRLDLQCRQDQFPELLLTYILRSLSFVTGLDNGGVTAVGQGLYKILCVSRSPLSKLPAQIGLRTGSRAALWQHAIPWAVVSTSP